VLELISTNPKAPDAVFPDWFTTHRSEDIPGGVFILYPMKHASRREERDQHMIKTLRENYEHFIDLTIFETQGLALEGKGPLMIDSRNQKIYCSL
jgi:hypothetical protein